MQVNEISELATKLIDSVEGVIVGKRDAVTKAVITLLCEGHLLLEDIPGVGKTTLAKALSRSIGGEFRRIQFTPDLLPSDITGGAIFNQRTSDFEFRPGPIFGNVVLADEINRATPKTQSALLEAMEEGQVSTDGETRRLPHPFFVIATQNSLEMTGTYPLPEAQLDRFFARISIGYPDKASEAAILDQQRVSHPIDLLAAVVTLDQLSAIQASVRQIHVDEKIRNYIVDVVRATRESTTVLLGSSPRGSLHLMRASQAHAAVNGRDYVRPDDVKAMAISVLSHRIMAKADSRSKGNSSDQIVEAILEQVPTPLPVA